MANKEYYAGGPAPETIFITSDEYAGITKINKDDFDPKKHTRVNEHGQPVDERGAVIIPKDDAPAASDAKKTK
jgi:hypothetical protein